MEMQCHIEIIERVSGADFGGTLQYCMRLQLNIKAQQLMATSLIITLTLDI